MCLKSQGTRDITPIPRILLSLFRQRCLCSQKGSGLGLDPGSHQLSRPPYCVFGVSRPRPHHMHDLRASPCPWKNLQCGAAALDSAYALKALTLISTTRYIHCRSRVSNSVRVITLHAQNKLQQYIRTTIHVRRRTYAVAANL